MGKNGYLERRKQQIQTVKSQSMKDAAERTMWLSVVALNDEFGFAETRAERFLKRLQKVAELHEAECADDYDLAVEHLRARLEKILNSNVTRLN